nr:MAG TPA: hypothetical protein [Caudoviricetes sp.]
MFYLTVILYLKLTPINASFIKIEIHIIITY